MEDIKVKINGLQGNSACHQPEHCYKNPVQVSLNIVCWTHQPCSLFWDTRAADSHLTKASPWKWNVWCQVTSFWIPPLILPRIYWVVFGNLHNLCFLTHERDLPYLLPWRLFYNYRTVKRYKSSMSAAKKPEIISFHYINYVDSNKKVY